MGQTVSRFSRRRRGRRPSRRLRVQHVELLEERTLLAGNSIADSGGFEGSQMTLPLDRNGGGYLEYEYEHFVIPDNFIIRYEGKNLVQTGFVGGNRSGQVSIPKGNSDFVTVIVATNDEGTAWNYSVTEQGCGDTWPMRIELAGGEFEDSDGNGTCEGTGTVYVGLENGIDQMIRIENATAEYDDTTLTVTGGTVFSEIGSNTTEALFTSDLSMTFTGANSPVTESSRADGLKLGGLDTGITNIALKPNGISLEGDFNLPPSLFFQGLTLANLNVPMKGNSALFIGEKGTGFGSDVGKTDFPSRFPWKLLDFIGVTNIGAKIEYVDQENGQQKNQLKIQGQFKVNYDEFVGPAFWKYDTISGTFDLTDDPLSGRENFIKIAHGVPDISAVLKVNNISLGDILEIPELAVELETQNGELIDLLGKGQVKMKGIEGAPPLPPSKSVSFELGGRKVAGEWHWDDIVGKFDGLNIGPFGASGLYFQAIEGGIKNLAPDPPPESYLVGIGLTGGPEYTIDFPRWFPIDDFNTSVMRMDGNFEFDLEGFASVNAVVKFVKDDVLEIGGRITFDPHKQTLDGAVTLKGLVGMINGNGKFKVDWGNRSATVSGSSSLKFPDHPLLFKYRGKEFAGGTIGGKVSFDDNPGNDYVAAWVQVDVPYFDRDGIPREFKKTIGLQLFFDGEFRRLGENNLPPIGSWMVPADSEFLLMSAEWENEVTDDVELRVIKPDGTVINEADFEDNGIMVVPAFTSPYAKTVSVGAPEEGIWDVEVVDPTGLTNLTYSAENDSETPTIDVITPDGQVAGGNVDIRFDAFDGDSQAEVSLFFDDDGEDFDGTEIVSGLIEQDGRGNYVWNTAGLAPGEYSIYAAIQDENNAPVFAYAPGTITVVAAADLSVTHTADNELPIVGSEVVYTIDVQNLGDSTAENSLVDFSISGGTITATSISTSDQTDTSATFDLGDVAANGTQSIEVTVQMPDTGPIQSTVVASTDSFDSDFDNNDHGLGIIVMDAPILNPDLTIELVTAPASTALGEEIQYEVRVRNNGDGPATNVVMTETLPAASTFVEATSTRGTTSYSSFGNTVTVDVGTLNPGQAAKLTVTITSFGAGDLISMTSVTSAEGDDNQVDNFLVTANSVQAIDPPPADLDLMVATDNEQPSLGDIFNITITVTNAGPGVASGIMIQNMIPPQLQVTSWNTPQGTYDTETGMWDVGNVRDDLSRSLTLTTEVISGGSGSFTAEIVGVNEEDPDSAPDNGAGEDDYASIDIQTGLSCDAEGSGNVRVWMTSGGNVRIRGNARDNAIAIVEDGGDIIVTGLGNTRINGSRDAYVIAEGTTRVDRNVTIRMRGGDDTVCAQSVHFRKDLDIYAGVGDDTFAASEVRVGDDFMAYFGSGHDQFAVDGFDVDGKTTIDFGAGHDIAMGRNVDLDDTVHIFGRAGRDLFAIRDMETSNNSYIKMGSGRDTVAMLGTNNLGGRTRVRGGGGRDSYEFSGSTNTSKKPRVTSFRNDSIADFDDQIESAFDRLMESGINVGSLLD